MISDKQLQHRDGCGEVKVKCHDQPVFVRPCGWWYWRVCAEESQGEMEVKDPCACESLVEFQQATMSSLEQLTQKHILSKNILEQMPALILESKLRFVTLWNLKNLLIGFLKTMPVVPGSCSISVSDVWRESTGQRGTWVVVIQKKEETSQI